MKSITLGIILFLSYGSVAQIVDLSFNECYVGSRFSPDSTYNQSGYFNGVGTVEIFKDSIVFSFSNEWECGKYLLYIEGKESYKDKKDYVTHYYGRSEYYGWVYDLFFVRDQFKNPSVILLDTGHTVEGIEYFSVTRRLYPILPENRVLINTH